MIETPITELIEAASEGSDSAMGRLFVSTYPQLRNIAVSKIWPSSRRCSALQPTALVHEAILRILRADSLSRTKNRASYFGLVARAMRSVLVDDARRRSAQKRAHPRAAGQPSLDQIVEQGESLQHLDILVLDEALVELQRFSERHHSVVMLRFFGGLSFPEIAAELDLSLSTIEKDWYFARAWLRATLDRE